MKLILIGKCCSSFVAVHTGLLIQYMHILIGMQFRKILRQKLTFRYLDFTVYLLLDTNSGVVDLFMPSPPTLVHTNT